MNSAGTRRDGRHLHAFATLAVMTAVLGGCASMTGPTAGENVDDARITTAVKATLAAERLAMNGVVNHLTMQPKG